MIELKRILVPLDGTLLSEAALPMALSLAQKYGSQIILLHALETPSSIKYVTHPDAVQLLQRVTDRLRPEMQCYLDEQQ